MFSNVVPQTAFTSPKADLYFQGKIVQMGSTYNNDKTFLSSMRAFLYNKMGENDQQRLYFGRYNLDPVTAANRAFADYASCTPDLFSVFDLAGSCQKFTQEDKAKIIDIASQYDFEYVEKVEALFAKEFSIMCFRRAETKSIVMLVPVMTIKKWHLMQCCILGIMPWFFNPENGLDEDDKDLMYSFKKGTDDDYQSVLNRIASKIDFKTQYIKTVLNGFEHEHERRLFDSTKSAISDLENEIRNLQERISGYLVDLEQHNERLIGLSEKINSNNGDSDLMRYFISNSHVDLVDVNGTRLTYICKGYLTYFDANRAESYINNLDSEFYIKDPYGNRKYQNAASDEDAQKLFKAIFVDKLLKVRMCAAYRIDTGRMRAEGLQGYQYGGEYDCYMVNPHIDYHACIGTFGGVFLECLQRNDYIGCVESTIASALSLTIEDYTVLGEFVTLLWSGKGNDRGTTNTGRCIELPNGACVTAKEAIEWLKEENYE